jgi:hypothetical protein
MATFNHISGAEPSTITFKAATVSMTRNSSVMHQELISLADPENAASVARISSAAPASSDAGLIVRQVGYSTVVSLAGPTSTAAPAASDTGVIVRQVGYVAPSTTVTVAAMPAGSTTVTIAAITGPISTAAPATSDTGVIVRQVGYSTIVSVAAFPANSSQVEVRTLPANSSVVAVGSIAAGLLSSAAPAGNSSALLVRIVGGPSSAADATFAVQGNTSSNSSVYLPVRLTNGTSFLAAANDYVSGSTYSSIAGPTLLFASDSLATMVHVASTNGLPVNIVAGAASGPTSTAAPASNDTGLVVRQVGYSTIVTVAALPANSSLMQVNAIAAGYLSTAAVAANSSALNVRVVGGPSSAADLTARIAGPTSTTWASSAGFHFDSSGALTVAASFTGSTGPLTISQLLDSSGGSVTAADSANQAIRVNVVAGAAGGSTIVTVSSLPMVSTAVPAANSSGLNIWIVGGNISSLSTGHVTVDNFSTTVTVAAFPANSSLVQINAIAAGYLSTAAAAANSSALNVRVVGGASSAVDFPVRAVLSSTNTDNPVVATIGTNLQSTSIPSSNSSGLTVRQVWDARSNAASTSAFATSTQFTISGSTAQQKYVCAYSITSTDLTATVVRFMGGSTLAWCARMQTISSLITGVTLSGYPYLFKTDAASSLTLNISGSSRAGWTVAVSYFLAP